MTEAYDAFAYAYDQALGKRFFNAVKRLLTELLARHSVDARTHLDLACGTGLAMQYFLQRGWSSTGIDASLPMLNVARRRARRLVAADLVRLPLRSSFGCITSLYDSLNHLSDTGELEIALREARAHMDAGSLLIFDINHPDIYPRVWGMDEPFVSSGPQHHLELATSFSRRTQTARGRARGWADVRGKRVPIDEVHEQRVFSLDDVHSALGRARLRCLEVVDFDPFREERREEKVKVVFVCRAAEERDEVRR